jgi:hypothetical protein
MMYYALWVLLWPLNLFFVFTAWGISSPVLGAIMWYYDLPLELWWWTLLLYFFSAPFFGLLAFVTGPTIPMPFRLFSTLNNTLDGGWDDHVSGFKDPATLSAFRLWLQRTRWTYRNPCNGWQSQGYGVADVTKAFTVKKDIPLLFRFYIKFWAGWNPSMRGGDYFPYMAQFGLKRKKE